MGCLPALPLLNLTRETGASSMTRGTWPHTPCTACTKLSTCRPWSACIPLVLQPRRQQPSDFRTLLPRLRRRTQEQPASVTQAAPLQQSHLLQLRAVQHLAISAQQRHAAGEASHAAQQLQPMRLLCSSSEPAAALQAVLALVDMALNSGGMVGPALDAIDSLCSAALQSQ